jgi:hypothetical protein
LMGFWFMFTTYIRQNALCLRIVHYPPCRRNSARNPGQADPRNFWVKLSMPAKNLTIPTPHTTMSGPDANASAGGATSGGPSKPPKPPNPVWRMMGTQPPIYN